MESSKPISIRRADPKDSEAVLALAQAFATSFEVQPESFTRSFAAVFNAPEAFLAVAEEAEVVIGYLLGFMHPAFYANGPVAWVEEVMVSPAHRGRGVGRVLMECMEEWAKSMGCPLIALATRRAAPFYAALGYEESAAYFRKLL
jgi:GNAT superfamily N-acetyltransferase